MSVVPERKNSLALESKSFMSVNMTKMTNEQDFKSEDKVTKALDEDVLSDGNMSENEGMESLADQMKL